MPRKALARLIAIDCALFDRVARSHTPALDKTLPKLTLAANNSVVWMVASALLTAFGGRRGKRAAHSYRDAKQGEQVARNLRRLNALGNAGARHGYDPRTVGDRP